MASYDVPTVYGYVLDVVRESPVADEMCFINGIASIVDASSSMPELTAVTTSNEVGATEILPQIAITGLVVNF